MRAIGLDLAPLRVSRGFRRLFTYSVVAGLASNATYVTLLYQLKQLTHSATDVGLLGAAEFFPIFIGGLYGGVLADRTSRRRVVVACELAALVVIAILWVNGLQRHPAIVVLYLVGAALAVATSLQGPSLGALTQSVVPHDLQRQASTLNMASGNVAFIVGPAVGGLVSVLAGPTYIYGADVVSLFLTTWLLVGLPTDRVVSAADESVGASFVAGARYAWSRPDVLGTYVIDLVAMTLAYPLAVLPFFAATSHQSDALALLYAAMPAGALIASVTSRWSHRVHHYGRAVVVAAAIWGLGIALLGVTGSLAVGVVGLMIAGGADAISGVFRTTMWNESIPPDIRGRMAGIELLSFSLGPTAGQIRAGTLASAISLRSSVVVGGVACAGGCATLPAALRATWGFDARTDVHVAQVRLVRSHDGLDVA